MMYSTKIKSILRWKYNKCMPSLYNITCVTVKYSVCMMAVLNIPQNQPFIYLSWICYLK